MSKKDDIKNQTSSIIANFIAPMESAVIENDKKIDTDTKKDDTIKGKRKGKIDISDADKRRFKNGKDLQDNDALTFKIDNDIADYFNNIEFVFFIESAKSGKIISKSRKEFLNDLIREKFYQLLDVSDDDTFDDIDRKWQKYKANNGL